MSVGDLFVDGCRVAWRVVGSGPALLAPGGTFDTRTQRTTVPRSSSVVRPTLLAVLVERETAVAVSADRVWQRIVTPEGINHELRPWMTMAMPRGRRELRVDLVSVGVPLGRCWLRLFGVVPFDYDDLTIVELHPGRGFVEESTMLSMRRWRHERTIEPLDAGRTRVRDHVTFELRAGLRVLTPVVGAVIGKLFAHRQRRLVAYFASTHSAGADHAD